MVDVTPSDVDANIPDLSDDETRARLYRAISNHVRDLTGGQAIPRMSKELGKHILEGVAEIVFTIAAREGYVRLPGGYGSLRVKRLKPDPKPKRLPTGRVIKLQSNRSKLVYEDGAAVRDLLGLTPKTNYQRVFQRESVLTEKTRRVLTGDKDE